MTHVIRTITPPVSADMRTGRPPSSTKVAQNTQNSINHLLGFLLGGLRHSQVAMDTATDSSDTARVYTYRHPQCQHVEVVILFDADASQTSWTVSATAGTGTTVTATAGYILESGTTMRLRVPWNSSDTGDQVVTITWSNVTIRGVQIWDLPRTDLESTENGVKFADSTYSRIGIGAEWYIAESAQAGPKAMIQEVIDAWDEYQPQVISWWTPTSSPRTITATSAGGKGAASDVFSGATLTHQCRQKRDSDTSQTTRWWIRAYCGAGTTYSLKVSTNSGGSGTVSGKTNTTASWIDIADVSMSAGSDDTFVVEAWRTAGTGSIYIEAVSGIEDS